MALGNNAAEMEAFQSLSDKWHPGMDQTGPLIGNKQGMDVLVTEYSQADPMYVVKTTGLAATHDTYRSVKGDGQCGWRATVFSYFEILLLSGDPSLVQQERIRFETYADTMRMVGIDYDLMVDMFDYTWELFDAIMHAVQQQNKNDQVILSIMNDENKSNSIVYHFKMVTSAYMKLREDEYAPFTENFSVDDYRIRRIDPTNEEIDQIGLQVLTDAVIRPAGLGLEVLYLDRSTGDVVTPHNFTPDNGNAPVIKLLYRPGHYDIIYQGQQQMPVVYLQYPHYDPQDIQHQDYNDIESEDLISNMLGAMPQHNQDASFMYPTWQSPQYQPNSYPQPYNYVPSVSLPEHQVYRPPQMTILPPSSMPQTWSAETSAQHSRRDSSSPCSATLSLSPTPAISATAQDNFRVTEWQVRYAQNSHLSSRPIILNNSR